MEQLNIVTRSVYVNRKIEMIMYLSEWRILYFEPFCLSHFKSNSSQMKSGISAFVFLHSLTLFVFLKSDLKQNARSLLTPVSDPAFHALSHGSLSFALHCRFFNPFIIGKNLPKANHNF